MLQVSVVGPMLFLIYENDLKTNLLAKVAHIENYTELGGKVICCKDYDKIQEDLNKLINWDELWLMYLNTENVRLCILATCPTLKCKMRDQEFDNIK